MALHDPYGGADDKGAVIRGKRHPVHQHLPAIKRAEIHRARIAQMDNAEQDVIRRVDDRDRVRELLGGIHPVAMADRNVRARLGAGGCPAEAVGAAPNATQTASRDKRSALAADMADFLDGESGLLRACLHRVALRRHRRRSGRGWEVVECQLHDPDFVLLGDDDLLREPPNPLVAPVAELGPRHFHGPWRCGIIITVKSQPTSPEGATDMADNIRVIACSFSARKATRTCNGCRSRPASAAALA